MERPELPLFVHWEAWVGELLDRTEKLPKHIRFTFTQRIENIALDVLEGLVEARYAPRSRTRSHLTTIDGGLTRLRVLLRLCHQRRHLSHASYEHLMRGLDEAGRMVGGWRLALSSKAPSP